ncbi:MAG: hypothetical protein JXA54_09785 [Candidatus Heimdallarchaeota archaeon]|nr:hypothetical protein [Candidatus Heimdallarchaeota archaeon]
MATTAIQWFAIIQGIIVTVASFIFVLIMIKNFIRKKTMGTALLAIFYIIFTLTQGSNTIFNIYSLFKPLFIGHKISILIYVSTLAFSYIVLYVFASRYILKDNEVIRMLNSVILIILPTVFFGMFGYELFREVAEPLLFTIEYQPGTEFLQYMPTMLMGIIIYIPFVILVHLRLIFTMSLDLLRKKINDPVRKTGWQLILFAVITLFLSVFLTVLFTIDGLTPIVVIVLYTTRAILLVLGLFLSYLGWILPTWLRSRIREKTWLAKNLKNIGKSTTRFVTSQTILEETKITEFSE